ncbi:glycosyltransferase family 2 protein [Candidatus Albibeggiatoa sp. nov. NOAA]|uniref:glycosyltransferase family 2 protein n=1 Tax=Candidatus Albibeggiatoa sp. nov. NOAA TaxID=3162724 RepID=UPI0032F57D04|nr:glycosyltransferase family 2 protein [Thiotrichaceae bacterium]
MLIQNKLPATALLDTDLKPFSHTFFGDIPVTLTADTQLQFQITPEQKNITGIRLRFGTYCRDNHCDLIIQFADYHTQRFNLSDLQDNEFIDIALDKSITVPQKPLTVTLSCENVDEQNMVAIWCTEAIPEFIDPFKQATGLQRLLNKPQFKPLHLPAVENPQVSIVIPVFNKVAYTYNCLLTVVDTDPDISKEVIILNNASSDETEAFLSQLQGGGFRVVNNKDNKGFVGACQQGGAMATGEFILLLNNDTQVRTGYLSNMLKVFDNDSDVGLVGSKLIYPDGRLQEAGGIIFNDASGCNYGRLQDPSFPHFNQNREVDYCSGASLMIRTELWQHWGGFDERYAPAYYEDTDLCFTARSKGYKVMYCHDSQVIHHEGITSGTDVTQGFKAFQVINHKKFYQKWRDVLTTQHCSPLTPPDKAAHHLAADYQTFSQISDNSDYNLQDLPVIFHYWSCRYLVPMMQTQGFENVDQLFIQTLIKQCQTFKRETCYFVSTASHDGHFESMLVEQLQQQGLQNFILHSLNPNSQTVEKLNQLAKNKNISDKLQFQVADLASWQPEYTYHAIIANHALNCAVHMDQVVERLQTALHPAGKLVIVDMIGEAGHQRAENVLPHIPALWSQLPDNYKFNLLTQQQENWFINHDYSHIGFEGTEAKTLVPLLSEKLHFELCLAYGNLIDVFIERAFGHHFDEHNNDDVAFIDQVQAIDQMLIEQGKIQPTHLIAVLQHTQS